MFTYKRTALENNWRPRSEYNRPILENSPKLLPQKRPIKEQISYKRNDLSKYIYKKRPLDNQINSNQINPMNNLRRRVPSPRVTKQEANSREYLQELKDKIFSPGDFMPSPYGGNQESKNSKMLKDLATTLMEESINVLNKQNQNQNQYAMAQDNNRGSNNYANSQGNYKTLKSQINTMNNVLTEYNRTNSPGYSVNGPNSIVNRNLKLKGKIFSDIIFRNNKLSQNSNNNPNNNFKGGYGQNQQRLNFIKINLSDNETNIKEERNRLTGKDNKYEQYQSPTGIKYYTDTEIYGNDSNKSNTIETTGTKNTYYKQKILEIFNTNNKASTPQNNSSNLQTLNIASPNPDNSKNQNKIDPKLLQQQIQEPSNQVKFLPPQKGDKIGKKTLILDLDETLVHSSFYPIDNEEADIKVSITFESNAHEIYVLKRPYVDEFLEEMSKHYELVIFTASIESYAIPVISKLDPKHLISYSLYRPSCTNTANLFIKDLRKVGRDLKDTIILDNNPISYAFNKDNGIPIITWHSNREDNELQRLIPFLKWLSTVEDVRTEIKKAVKESLISYPICDRLIAGKYIDDTNQFEILELKIKKEASKNIAEKNSKNEQNKNEDNLINDLSKESKKNDLSKENKENNLEPIQEEIQEEIKNKPPIIQNKNMPPIIDNKIKPVIENTSNNNTIVNSNNADNNSQKEVIKNNPINNEVNENKANTILRAKKPKTEIKEDSELALSPTKNEKENMPNLTEENHQTKNITEVNQKNNNSNLRNENQIIKTVENNNLADLKPISKTIEPKENPKIIPKSPVNQPLNLNINQDKNTVKVQDKAPIQNQMNLLNNKDKERLKTIEKKDEINEALQKLSNYKSNAEISKKSNFDFLKRLENLGNSKPINSNQNNQNIKPLENKINIININNTVNINNIETNEENHTTHKKVSENENNKIIFNMNSNVIMNDNNAINSINTVNSINNNGLKVKQESINNNQITNKSPEKSTTTVLGKNLFNFNKDNNNLSNNNRMGRISTPKNDVVYKVDLVNDNNLVNDKKSEMVKEAIISTKESIKKLRADHKKKSIDKTNYLKYSTDDERILNRHKSKKSLRNVSKASHKPSQATNVDIPKPNSSKAVNLMSQNTKKAVNEAVFKDINNINNMIRNSPVKNQRKNSNYNLPHELPKTNELKKDSSKKSLTEQNAKMNNMIDSNKKNTKLDDFLSFTGIINTSGNNNRPSTASPNHNNQSNNKVLNTLKIDTANLYTNRLPMQLGGQINSSRTSNNLYPSNYSYNNLGNNLTNNLSTSQQMQNYNYNSLNNNLSNNLTGPQQMNQNSFLNRSNNLLDNRLHSLDKNNYYNRPGIDSYGFKFGLNHQQKQNNYVSHFAQPTQLASINLDMENSRYGTSNFYGNAYKSNFSSNTATHSLNNSFTYSNTYSNTTTSNLNNSFLAPDSGYERQNLFKNLMNSMGLSSSSNNYLGSSVQRNRDYSNQIESRTRAYFNLFS